MNASPLGYVKINKSANQIKNIENNSNHFSDLFVLKKKKDDYDDDDDDDGGGVGCCEKKTKFFFKF